MDSKSYSGRFDNRTLDFQKKIKALEYAQKINYTLYDISNAVNTTRNLEQLYQSIYDSLNRLMTLPNFFIALYDGKARTINFEFFIDEFDDDFPIIEDLNAPNCLTGEVLLSRRPLFLKENMLIEREQKNKLIGSLPKVWMGVPLIVQDSVIGAIAVQHYSDPDYFSHQHLEILTSVSEQIAIAIERKQIIDKLEKKEKTLSLITDNTSSIIAIINASGLFEFANPAYRFLGYSEDDLPGKSFFDLVHPADIQPLMQFLEKGIKGKVTHTTLKLRVLSYKKSYQVIKGSFDIIKNEDGFFEKLIFIGEDISTREKVQKALKESEKRFKIVFDTSPDAIMLTKLNSGEIVDVNTTFLNLSGLKKERLIGKTTTQIDIWKNPQERSELRSFLLKKGSVENIEATLNFRGKSVLTLISSKPIMIDGEPHLLSIIRDISAKKELDEQLIRRRKMDAMGILAGGLAHDFNNLISGIMGYLELLDCTSETFSENQKDNLTKAMVSSRRAAKLVQQWQTLSKSNTLKPAAVDLYQVTEEVFNILEQTADPIIEFKNELIENQCLVDGYKEELHQAFINLGANAAQAIGPDSVSGSCIRVFRPKETLSHFVLPENNAEDIIHLCFQDTGCGMTREIKEHAFDPMFTTKQMGEKKGQGLGLSMVYYIISKKHHGHIEIETKPGYGTTFHLFLPRSKSASVKKNLPQQGGGSRTILVIEDEDMVRDMAAKALEAFGYKTFEAEDGKIGLDFYKKHRDRIDAVLLDIIMPNMSGVETFKEIKKINADAKIIVTSGHITNKEQKKLFSKATAYLDKPYQISKLKHVLEKVLESQ